MVIEQHSCCRDPERGTDTEENTMAVSQHLESEPTQPAGVTTPDELPATITVEQAGELLGVSRRSAYRAASTGELPTLKLGRRILVPTARLLDLLGLTREEFAAVDIPNRR